MKIKDKVILKFKFGICTYSKSPIANISFCLGDEERAEMWLASWIEIKELKLKKNRDYILTLKPARLMKKLKYD